MPHGRRRSARRCWPWGWPRSTTNPSSRAMGPRPPATDVRRRLPHPTGGAVADAARESTDGRADERTPTPCSPPSIPARFASASTPSPTPVTHTPSAYRPAPGPLRMTNPTVGRGPLGGAAMAPQDSQPEGVSAQRQLLVDDAPSDATVTGLGGGRYLLEEGIGVTRVILEAVDGRRGWHRRREVLVDGFRFVVDVGVGADRGAAGAGEPGPRVQRPRGPAAGQGDHPG